MKKMLCYQIFSTWISLFYENFPALCTIQFEKKISYPTSRSKWIFSSQAVFGITLNSSRSSIDKSLKASIAATTLTLLVKHSRMDLSFCNGLSFEKGLGLPITPLYFSACDNPITVVSVALIIPFFVIFVGILTSLKVLITSFWSK